MTRARPSSEKTLAFSYFGGMTVTRFSSIYPHRPFSMYAYRPPDRQPSHSYSKGITVFPFLSRAPYFPSFTAMAGPSSPKTTVSYSRGMTGFPSRSRKPAFVFSQVSSQSCQKAWSSSSGETAGVASGSGKLFSAWSRPTVSLYETDSYSGGRITFPEASITPHRESADWTRKSVSVRGKRESYCGGTTTVPSGAARPKDMTEGMLSQL